MYVSTIIYAHYFNLLFCIVMFLFFILMFYLKM